ncbi:MAG: hypothetical protein K8F91_00090 [Candidatus Obscuribacterales bacterium]|nr:hypothetical protein [Candidatus Obscuribacterales bacterium]
MAIIVALTKDGEIKASGKTGLNEKDLEQAAISTSFRHGSTVDPAETAQEILKAAQNPPTGIGDSSKLLASNSILNVPNLDQMQQFNAIQTDAGSHQAIQDVVPVSRDAETEPILLAEAKTGTVTGKAKNKGRGDYVTVQTQDGKLNIPAGDPAFGLPSNFEAYSKNVNEYVKWIKTWNGNSYDWNDMSSSQKEDFANALRHPLGIGFLVFQGTPPAVAIQKALGHEEDV